MWWLSAVWIAFFITFYWSHRQVRARSRPGPERRVRRDRSSDVGMALQFAAIVVALFWPGPWREFLVLPALLLAGVSISFVRAALVNLDRQWRVQAVITDDHELITNGPYRLVRHPVYLAFLGMLASTLMMRGAAVPAAAALLIFVIGTEIRVRAEERLLALAFADRFSQYLVRTRWAYLPGMR